MKYNAEKELRYQDEIRKIWYPSEETESAPSDTYEPNVCEVCGREMVEGDWPYCKGDMNDHITQRSSRNAARLRTVFYESSEGEVWVPTGPNAQPPKGWERVELTSLQQVDKYMSQVNKVRNEIADYHLEQERQQWFDHLKSVRRDMESHSFTHNGQQLPGIYAMSPQGREMYEKAMEEARAYNPKRSQESFLEAQYFDASSMHD